MKPETAIQNAIANLSSKVKGLRLFRNVVGKLWAGRVVARGDGMVTLAGGVPVDVGLAIGSGDLIGWLEVEITQEMVGRRVAVFTSIEVKTEKGRVQDNQRVWKDVVARHGGIAGVARSTDEAMDILMAWRKTISKQ
jgi:hypothetical protein